MEGAHGSHRNRPDTAQHPYRLQVRKFVRASLDHAAWVACTSAGLLYMCRGDVTLDVCNQCVVEATKKLTSDCKFSKEAIVWYDECMLRYSNTSFFSKVDTRPRLGLLNTGNIANPASFMRLLFNTMNKTADVAAKPGLGKKKYATNEAFISGFQTLYVLAQCTPDLSPQDCRRCLSGVIGDLNWCCDGKQGGRVLYPSCNVRYELYPFYRTP